MNRLKIDRLYQKNCTLGVVKFGKFQCLSLELPWLDNKTNVSCIPPGVYECEKRFSEKNGEVFQLVKVIGRTYIQGHIGNFTRDIAGCIIFGDSIKDIDRDGILDVTNSTQTFRALMNLLPNKFILEIGI